MNNEIIEDESCGRRPTSSGQKYHLESMAREPWCFGCSGAGPGKERTLRQPYRWIGKQGSIDDGVRTGQDEVGLLPQRSCTGAWWEEGDWRGRIRWRKLEYLCSVGMWDAMEDF